MFVNEVICIAFAVQNLCGGNNTEMATFITLNLLGTQIMPHMFIQNDRTVLGLNFCYLGINKNWHFKHMIFKIRHFFKPPKYVWWTALEQAKCCLSWLLLLPWWRQVPLLKHRLQRQPACLTTVENSYFVALFEVHVYNFYSAVSIFLWISVLLNSHGILIQKDCWSNENCTRM